jgi:hypothetical protein
MMQFQAMRDVSIYEIMERCSLNEADELLRICSESKGHALYFDTIFKSSGKTD